MALKHRKSKDSRIAAASTGYSRCRCGLACWKAGGEGGTVFRYAFDQEPPTVTGQYVFDQRQTEPGAALRTAIADIDPVKPLGEPRQMFGRDAWSEIAHQHANFRRPFG